MADAVRLSSALLAAAASGAAALCACVSATPPRSVARPPAVAPAAADVDYDWRALVPVPFGTLLKDMPVALTEVWQFHEVAQSGRGTEERECYTLKDSPPPPLLGRRTDDYLLCFDHDRLNRVEAAVRLPEEAAAPRFAAACAQWRRRARAAAGEGAGGGEEAGAGAAGQGEVGADTVGQGAVGTGAAGDPAVGKVAAGKVAAGENAAGRCEGRDGATDFSARMSSAAESARAGDSDAAGPADSPASGSMATVSLSLTALAP